MPFLDTPTGRVFERWQISKAATEYVLRRALHSGNARPRLHRPVPHHRERATKTTDHTARRCMALHNHRTTRSSSLRRVSEEPDMRHRLPVSRVLASGAAHERIRTTEHHLGLEPTATTRTTSYRHDAHTDKEPRRRKQTTRRKLRRQQGRRRHILGDDRRNDYAADIWTPRRSTTDRPKHRRAGQGARHDNNAEPHAERAAAGAHSTYGDLPTLARSAEHTGHGTTRGHDRWQHAPPSDDDSANDAGRDTTGAARSEAPENSAIRTAACHSSCNTARASHGGARAGRRNEDGSERAHAHAAQCCTAFGLQSCPDPEHRPDP